MKIRRSRAGLIGIMLLISLPIFAQTFATARKDGNFWVDNSKFLLSEKPCFHVSVPDKSFKRNWLLSFWNHQTSFSFCYLDDFLRPFSETEKFERSKLYFTFEKQLCERLKKAGDWNTGDWNISSALVLCKSGPNFSVPLVTYHRNVSFKVVPEPTAAYLFLIGGGVISFLVRRKRTSQK
ncbi:MAG: PEP-CTERM sorting domain-containing protein [Candidatus Omnitrophica bacterium]|nr:PEP-CTERM sorting domain-containing protein [Candidatus Omnitrophota bacterium]